MPRHTQDVKHIPGPIASQLLNKFLQPFHEAFEHDQPISGCDAVDAIRELYDQVNSLTRRTAPPTTRPA